MPTNDLSSALDQDCSTMSFTARIEFCEQANDVFVSILQCVRSYISIRLERVSDILNNLRITPQIVREYLVRSGWTCETGENGLMVTATKDFTTKQELLDFLNSYVSLAES